MNAPLSPSGGLRVCQMIDTLDWGGAQVILVQMTKAMCQRGIDVSVVSLVDGSKRKSQNPAPYSDQLIELGVPIEQVPARGIGNLKRISRLVSYLRNGKFDVLHTSLQYANILGNIAGRLAGVPVVSSLHSTEVDPLHYEPTRYRLENFLLHHAASRVIAIGYAVASANQRRVGSRHVDIIPNAVSIPPLLSNHRRQKIRLELTGDAERPLVISVGRLSPPKCYDDLLEVFAGVRNERPDAFLAIVGDGSLRQELEAKIASLNLNDDVLLTGARTDVSDLLGAADLYVSSSNREGLSVAMLEAMAAGLPVISTDVGDAPHLLASRPDQPAVGILVPASQPQPLMHAIINLLDDPAQAARMGSAARQRVIDENSIDGWCDRILSLYGEVSRRKGDHSTGEQDETR